MPPSHQPVPSVRDIRECHPMGNYLNTIVQNGGRAATPVRETLHEWKGQELVVFCTIDCFVPSHPPPKSRCHHWETRRCTYQEISAARRSRSFRPQQQLTKESQRGRPKEGCSVIFAGRRSSASFAVANSELLGLLASALRCWCCSVSSSSSAAQSQSSHHHPAPSALRFPPPPV